MTEKERANFYPRPFQICSFILCLSVPPTSNQWSPSQNYVLTFQLNGGLLLHGEQTPASLWLWVVTNSQIPPGRVATVTQEHLPGECCKREPLATAIRRVRGEGGTTPSSIVPIHPSKRSSAGISGSLSSWLMWNPFWGEILGNCDCNQMSTS